MNKGTTPSGAHSKTMKQTEQRDWGRGKSTKFAIDKMCQVKEGVGRSRSWSRSRRSGSYRRHRVLIVLNNCTTMGPKYVDRKVMKGSRAKLQLSVATGIEMAAAGVEAVGGAGGGRQPETELEAG